MIYENGKDIGMKLLMHNYTLVNHLKKAVKCIQYTLLHFILQV